jgi:DNA polymerase-4
MLPAKSQRKIIHIDMDCFYAAIEIRDNPSLADKPVAVGGRAEERSVLCTCNYIARQFGVRSAMASAYALRLCPELIILPVNMNKYREASQEIIRIFQEYTSEIEPLSLDEAYLDVTDSPHCQGSATWIAKEIREKILARLQLTASAGVAPNKFLAKIASGWKKPNGLFVIRPHEIDNFVKELPVEELFGVGKVTAEKLHQQGLKTCSDLQKLSLPHLTQHFGKMGQQLYDQCRGIDHRKVEPNRVRKSLSVERTFLHDINMADDCSDILKELYDMLIHRLEKYAPDRRIKNQYLKIKSSDFKLSTVERISHETNFEEFEKLFMEMANKEIGFIRLIGMGVHFHCDEQREVQQSLL